jgi:hypothetical protein
MSDQTLALSLTLALFAAMAAWVPLLDFLQRALRRRRVIAKNKAKSNYDPLSTSAVDKQEPVHNAGASATK